jgi:hypothetical protein
MFRKCWYISGIVPESITSVDCLYDAWNISVYLPPLHTKYPSLNISDIYLGIDNGNCTGYVDGSYLFFTQKYSSCQNTEKVVIVNKLYCIRNHITLISNTRKSCHIIQLSSCRLTTLCKNIETDHTAEGSSVPKTTKTKQKQKTSLDLRCWFFCAQLGVYNAKLLPTYKLLKGKATITTYLLLWIKYYILIS